MTAAATSDPLPSPGAFDARLLSVANQWNLIYRPVFTEFLRSFRPEPSREAQNRTQEPGAFVETSKWSYYQNAALDIARYNVHHLLIHIEHIAEWSEGLELAAFVQTYFLTLWTVLDEAVDQFVKETIQAYFESSDKPKSSQIEPDFLHDMVTYYKSRFYCNIIMASQSITVRQLRTDILGQLINLRGTATRMSDVRPELVSASFECCTCHATVEDTEQQFKYTEPRLCSNPECRNRSLWRLCPESCRFIDWQKLRLQENSSEIPAGSIPRSIEVVLRRNLTDQCKPGDKVVITGCLAAVPDVPSLMKPGEIPRSVAIDRNRAARTEMGAADIGVRGLKQSGLRDLSYRLVVFALSLRTITSGLDVKEHDYTDREMLAEEEYAAKQFSDTAEMVMAQTLGLSPQVQNLFISIANAPDTLDRLITTVAPEIFGCEYVKKGILLMLVGGVEKTSLIDQLKLRGDINVCIVGDPGTAKSQLLKFVHQFATGRAVYAAGNTSTAAGLTVSIHKDPDTGNSAIEAGALMLADQGICCIDEFDKMDAKDMVAIHEAMEQKTISICKAGIQATLNARASILAACNPRYGRYDLSKSFRQNIKLSQPIISRFDLFFALVDDTDRDSLIAQHLVNLHMTASLTPPQDRGESELASGLAEKAILSREQLRKYLAVARSCLPIIDEDTAQILVDSYVLLRAEEAQSVRSARVTVRQLEALIRLSEAVAKLKFSPRVLACHVQEARKIMQYSLLKVQQGTLDLDLDASSSESQQGDDNDNDDDNNKENAEPSSGKREALSQHGSLDVGQTTIDAEEYKMIAQCLVDRFKAIEIELAASPEAASSEQALEAIIAKEDLIAWYIDTMIDPVVAQSETNYEKLYVKLNKVIGRMVKRDFILIEEMREMNVPVGDEDLTEIRTIPALRLHPNVTSQVSDFDAVQHATLSTGFFAPTGSVAPVIDALLSTLIPSGVGGVVLDDG